MAYEQKDNSGSIFINDKKQSASHPDRSGSALIDGVEYWVSGWLKESNGKPWLSLAFKRKEQTHKQAAPVPAPLREALKRTLAEEIDDEIPF